MMDTSTGWSPQDPTLSGPDDFQFLDMGINDLSDNLQFDFAEFNTQQAQNAQEINNGECMDTRMENRRDMMRQHSTMQEHIPAITSTSMQPSRQAPIISHNHPSSESLGDIDAQIQYLQYQRQQEQQRQLRDQQRNYYARSRMIPPTPNSIEMHAATSHFYSHSDPQQQAIYERYQMQMKEQEMAFTPLVSPAVTPLEAHFNVPEYTVPGAYFSPLSSPALHAQSEHSSVYDHRLSGTTNSPVDINVDSHSAPSSSQIHSKKPNKKPAAPKTKNTRGVRQSPIVKPKKKKSSVTGITPQSLGHLIEPAHTQAHLDRLIGTGSSQSAASTENSENGSISPEHLSEMAPPPIPLIGSAGRSPYVQAQKDKAVNQRLSLNSPATPASLMRLGQSPQSSQFLPNESSMDIDDPMDEFALPEPAAAANRATTGPQLSRIETQSDGQITPTMSSLGAKTPGIAPLPSPSVGRSKAAASASQSPQIDSLNGANGSRKTPQMIPRGAKKRSGTSILASPALLPRISPGIKPLLPGNGKTTEDTASLLLASKSNYQNILEGNHLPGVSYPQELSTNLTSKRTSHKIAEQGRRNRINSALQEIATLLPRGQGKESIAEICASGEGAEGDSSGKAAAQSASSKASTVEQAIEYIKQLKSDLVAAKERAEKAEQALATKS